MNSWIKSHPWGVDKNGMIRVLGYSDLVEVNITVSPLPILSQIVLLDNITYKFIVFGGSVLSHLEHRSC